MNNTISVGVVRLGSAALLIWAGWVLWLFTPVHTSASAAASQDALPEIAAFARCCFVLSSVLLLISLKFRKAVNRHFIDLQALAALLPLTFLATEGTFVSYAVVRLGYVPRPNRPDPALIGLGMGEFTIYWNAILAGAFVCYLILYWRGLIDWSDFGARCVALSCFTVLWLGFWLIVKYDVFSFINWLGD
jgi:hypothetical protein